MVDAFSANRASIPLETACTVVAEVCRAVEQRMYLVLLTSWTFFISLSQAFPANLSGYAGDRRIATAQAFFDAVSADLSLGVLVVVRHGFTSNAY